MSGTDVRVALIRLLQRMNDGGGSLTRLLPEAQARVPDADRALLQSLGYGLCRWSGQLQFVVDALMQKPLKRKDEDIYLLLQLGVYQLQHSHMPAHAAVDSAVNTCKKLGKPWAKALVNGVLRNYQRKAASINNSMDDAARYAHPAWLLQRLQLDWPGRWQDIATQANKQAPMTLRVNLKRQSTDEYLQRLQAENLSATASTFADSALTLRNAVPVNRLPGFDNGDVSVQDAAAQLAAGLLPPSQGRRLLDACAAPGGKTAHAAEAGDWAGIVALDQDSARLERVSQTLERVGETDRVRCVCANAADLASWWDAQPFDAVLLDAPCSGTGVIRRHPDIKMLRRDADIATLVATQKSLLGTLWRVLKPGGHLLYATCSVLKDENEHQVKRFLGETADAIEVGIEAKWGQARPIGRQILPGEHEMDGFYYALLKKSGK